MGISKLQSFIKGTSGNMTGADIASSVNQLIDIAIPPNFSLSGLKDEVVEAEIPVGTIIQTKEYFEGTNLGGNSYEICNSGSSERRPREDGGAVIHIGKDGLYLRGIFSGKIDVTKFGVVPEVDCSVQMLNVYRYAVSIVCAPLYIPGNNNNSLGAKIFFPNAKGTYIFNEPRCMMDSDYVDARMAGLAYEGESGGVHIHFGYDSGGERGDLFYNDDKFLSISFDNLFFTSNSDQANFMFSRGDGGAQHPIFRRVKFGGTWSSLFLLRGGNNNSEWVWDACDFTLNIIDVMLDMDGHESDMSDQFLNFWFTNCKIWIYTGGMLRASSGGHFKFINCDWSGYTPTKETYMFELLGEVHARGVCDFRILGGRFELKNDNALLLYCEWGQGTVFIDADCNSNFYSDPDNKLGSDIASVVFSRGNSAGPSIEFKGSYQGIHQYFSGVNGFDNDSRAVYSSIQIPHDCINDFIKVKSTTNRGSDWRVECDDAITLKDQSNEQIILNATLGGKTGRGSSIKKRFVKFSSAQGNGTPLGSKFLKIKMPCNAFITAVSWFNSGALTSYAPVDFSLQDELGVTISSQSGLLRNAWYTVDNVGYQLDETRRTIRLLDVSGNSNQVSHDLWCAVEYIFG